MGERLRSSWWLLKLAVINLYNPKGVKRLVIAAGRQMDWPA